MKNRKKNILSLEILDSLSVRFLIDVDFENIKSSERLFFMLEEAHWFLIDNYGIKSLALSEFVSIILSHIKVKINVAKALQNFIRYRQSIKVYGAIIFNRNLDKILIVREDRKHKNYGMPKGKKNKDEDGVSCAIREVYEEIGYDITDKIVDIPISFFDKITLYFVFNVPEDTKFSTLAKNEIREIKWMDVARLNELHQDKTYTLITRSYSEWKEFHSLLLKNRFVFDKAPFEKIMKKVVCDKLKTVS